VILVEQVPSRPGDVLCCLAARACSEPSQTQGAAETRVDDQIAVEPMQAAEGSDFDEQAPKQGQQGSGAVSSLPADVVVMFRAAQSCGVPADAIARAAMRFQRHVSAKVP
jgi:hypothetical protein